VSYLRGLKTYHTLYFIFLCFTRNFANKLWNAGKYVQICLAGVRDDAARLDALTVRGPMSAAELATLPVPERYIVSRCHEVVGEVTRALEALSFGDAGRVVHDFLWDELADWYIEASKVRMRAAEGGAESPADAADHQQRTRRVLVYVWETCMRLLHPFMPYLTETLWQQLPHAERSVMLADWPQLQDEAGSESALPTDATAVRQFGSLQATVRSIRNARAEYGVDPGRKIPCVLVVADAALRAVLQQERSVFALLGRVQDTQLQILGPEEATKALSGAGACVHLIVEEGVEAHLPQSGLLDPQKERLRLSRQAEKLGKDIQVLSGRLASPGFVDRAPPHLVAEAKTKLAELQDQLSTVTASMEALV
jgi:valyl-tRNA synthetase